MREMCPLGPTDRDRAILPYHLRCNGKVHRKTEGAKTQIAS